MSHPGRGRHIGKGAVAPVAVEHIGRVPGRARAVGHVEIEDAVAVEVAPRRAKARPRIARARRLGHIGEDAPAIVLEQRVHAAAKPAVARHVQIGVTIVVVIGRLHPNSALGQHQPGSLRPLGKARAIVAKVRQGGMADDDQVEVAVLVVVGPRAGAASVELIDPCLGPDFAKPPADRFLRHGIGKGPGCRPPQYLLQPLPVPAQLQRLGMQRHGLLQNRVGAHVVLLPQRGNRRPVERLIPLGIGGQCPLQIPFRGREPPLFKCLFPPPQKRLHNQRPRGRQLRVQHRGPFQQPHAFFDPPLHEPHPP